VRYSELPLLEARPEMEAAALEDLRTMTKAVEQGYVIPKVPEWPQAESVLSEAISAAVSLTKTPEQALNDAAKEIEQLMK